MGKKRPRHSCDTSCNSLSGPVVAVPALKGEEKNKTCRKAANPHSGEVFGDLTLCKKASSHHANLPLEMYSFTL